MLPDYFKSQVRPPGHHAGVKQAMGFCLHNNAAVSVLAAQAAGAKKVLIVDWVRSLFFSQVVGPITVLISLSHNAFSFHFILSTLGCSSWKWNTGNI